MAKKTLSREAKKMAAETTTFAAAKSVVVKVAEKVVKVVEKAAEAAQEHVVTPVAEAVGIVKKPKKPVFVREKKVKKPEVKLAPLPPRSTKPAGKMMSKNLTLLPKDELQPGPKSKKTVKP